VPHQFSRSCDGVLQGIDFLLVVFGKTMNFKMNVPQRLPLLINSGLLVSSQKVFQCFSVKHVETKTIHSVTCKQNQQTVNVHANISVSQYIYRMRRRSFGGARSTNNQPSQNTSSSKTLLPDLNS